MKVCPKTSNYGQNRLSENSMGAKSLVSKPKTNLNKGLPSDLKLPAASKPINMSKLSKKELDMKIQKSYDDMVAGKTKSAKQVFTEIRKDYSI